MAKNRIAELEPESANGGGPRQHLASVNGDNEKSPGSSDGTGGGDRDANFCGPTRLDPAGSQGKYIEALKLGDARRRVLPPPDDETERTAPFLWELLTLDSYADGSNRPLAEIVIRRTSGVYEVGIRDHASRQSKQGACLTLGALVEALEAILCDPTRPWKPYDSYINPDPDKKDGRGGKRA